MRRAGSRRQRGLLGAFSVTSLALATSQGLTGLTYLLAARWSTPSEFGRAVVSLSVGSVLVNAFDAGLSTWLAREVAAQRLGDQEPLRLLRQKAGLVVLPGAITALVSHLAGGSYALAGVAAVYMVLLWVSSCLSTHLRSVKQFGRSGLALAGSRLVAFGAFFWLSSVIASPVALAVSLALAAGIETTADLLVEGRRSPSTFRSSVRVVVAQRRSFAYGVTSLASMMQQLDSLVVSLFAGVRAAGIFGAASRLLGPLSFPAFALAQVFVPGLARAGATARGSRLSPLERRALGSAGALSSLPMLAGLVGYFAIPRVLGMAYEETALCFLILSLGSVAAYINQMCAMVLQARNRDRWVGLVVASGILMGLALAGFLAARFGVVGASWGFVVGQCLILLLLAVGLANAERSLGTAGNRQDEAPVLGKGASDPTGTGP